MNGVLPGKGTIDEPYLVEDVYDLCNLSEYNGTSDSELSYVKLVANIDFNNHSEFKYGCGYKKLNINGRYMIFDGNNKEIRNLYLVNRNFRNVNSSVSIAAELPVFWFYDIHNTNFVNIVMEGCGNYSTDHGNGWLYATINEHNSYNIYAITLSTFRSCIPDNMNECVFNFRAYQNNPALWKKLIKNSLVNIDIKSGSEYIFNGASFDHCVIQGKFEFTSEHNYYWLFGSGNSGYSFVSDFINIKTNKAIHIYNKSTDLPTLSGVTILNKSAMPLTSNASIPSKIIPLLEADCKNTETLASKGFPVVEG